MRLVIRIRAYVREFDPFLCRNGSRSPTHTHTPRVSRAREVDMYVCMCVRACVRVCVRAACGVRACTSTTGGPFAEGESYGYSHGDSMERAAVTPFGDSLAHEHGDSRRGFTRQSIATRGTRAHTSSSPPRTSKSPTQQPGAARHASAELNQDSEQLLYPTRNPPYSPLPDMEKPDVVRRRERESETGGSWLGAGQGAERTGTRGLSPTPSLPRALTTRGSAVEVCGVCGEVRVETGLRGWWYEMAVERCGRERGGVVVREERGVSRDVGWEGVEQRCGGRAWMCEGCAEHVFLCDEDVGPLGRLLLTHDTQHTHQTHTHTHTHTHTPGFNGRIITYWYFQQAQDRGAQQSHWGDARCRRTGGHGSRFSRAAGNK